MFGGFNQGCFDPVYTLCFVGSVHTNEISYFSYCRLLVCSLRAAAVLKQDVAAKKQKNIESLTRTRSPAIRSQSQFIWQGKSIFAVSTDDFCEIEPEF